MSSWSVSRPGAALSGSGITLANLFRGWSADRIAQVYGEPLAPDAALCSRAWRLASSDVRVDRAVRWALAATGTASKLSRPGFDPHGSSEGPTAKAGGARARLHLIARGWSCMFLISLVGRNLGVGLRVWARGNLHAHREYPVDPGSFRPSRVGWVCPSCLISWNDWRTTHYSGDPAVFLPRSVLEEESRGYTRN